MKIADSLGEGIKRSVRSWKVLLIIWFVYLLLVSLVAIPVKASLAAGLGNSMVTEKLRDGLNIEVFADLGGVFKSISSFISKGLMVLILVSFIINAFFSGGLFSNLKSMDNATSVQSFFVNSARRFWSFFIISLIISISLLLIILLVLIIPTALATGSDKVSESATFNIIMVCIAVFVLILTVILLAADYARVWQSANEKNNCFRAIGFGFRQTFRTFGSSFPLMLIILIVQAAFVYLSFRIIAYMKPNTGIGVFLLFIISQSLFYIRLMLKTWRYSSVTMLLQNTHETH